MEYMNGFTVRKRVALLALASVFAVSLIAAGSAWAWYINVRVYPQAEDFCRPAPDLIAYRLSFTATVDAQAIAAPDKVRVGFQIVDRKTKRVLRSGVLNLKSANGYTGKTPRFMATASQNVSYHLNMSYKAGGRTLKAKKSFPDTIPSQEALDASGLGDC